nr:hypothetical protein [Tanacetum cinerariifolium]
YSAATRIFGGVTEVVFVARQNKNVVEEVVDVAQVSTATTIVTITTKEITLAQALEALKTSKPKVKGIVIQDLGESTTTIPKQQSQDKGKGIMTKEPDDIQAKIDADHQLAERLQAQEQEELSDAEKATLFQQLLEKRRKAFKRVNTFEDFRTELVEGKEKRAGEELIQESTKKQKVEDDKEKAELNQLMETIIDEEEVVIDAIPLAVKSPR